MATVQVSFLNKADFPVNTVIEGPTSANFTVRPLTETPHNLVQLDMLPGTYAILFSGGDRVLPVPNIGITKSAVINIPEGLRSGNENLVVSGSDIPKTCEVFNDKDTTAALRFHVDGGYNGLPNLKVPTLSLSPSQKISFLLNAGTEHTFVIELGNRAARVTIKGSGEYAKLYLSSIFPHLIPGHIKFLMENPEKHGGESYV